MNNLAAKRLAESGEICEADLARLYRIARASARCSAICTLAASCRDSGVKLEIDRIVSYILGGSDDNLQTLGVPCDRGKGKSMRYPAWRYLALG